MKRPRMYDSRCYDLAHGFLSEVPDTTDKHTDELATLLQQTAEDYIDGLRKEGK